MNGNHRIPLVLFFLGTLVLRIQAEPQVYILAENLEQVITSSTLEWVPYNNRIEVLLKNAVVSAYQIKENESSDGAEKTDEDFLKVPVYVCRAKVAAIWVPGQYRKHEKVCIVSLYRKVSIEKNFEVLINREKRSKLSWVHKNKYKITPQGCVEGGDKMYVARRPVKYHNKDGALTHFPGNFNPSENLGVFSLIDQNNQEMKYEDGEILVEKEPITYEFKHVKFDRIKSKHKYHPKILGSVVLKNEEQGLQRVDSVLSYNFTQYMNWGKDHGLLRGLPFTVEQPNDTKFSGNWGIPRSFERSETKPIERYLAENTAVNVTLKGNYTESDIPYVATVTAFFNDNETLQSILRDSLVMKHMTGVVIEFSPVYFLNNNTLVPTTTTTTTTIRTTQTTQSQTVPVNIPNTEDIYVLDDKSEKPISNEVLNIEESSSGNTDDNTVSQLTKKEDSNNANCMIITSSYLLIFLNVLLMQIT